MARLSPVRTWALQHFRMLCAIELVYCMVITLIYTLYPFTFDQLGVANAVFLVLLSCAFGPGFYLVECVRLVSCQRLSAEPDGAGWRVCPTCIFDLTSSTSSGICPECGTAYTAQSLQSDWRKKVFVAWPGQPFRRSE